MRTLALCSTMIGCTLAIVLAGSFGAAMYLKLQVPMISQSFCEGSSVDTASSEGDILNFRVRVICKNGRTAEIKG